MTRRARPALATLALFAGVLVAGCGAQKVDPGAVPVPAATPPADHRFYEVYDAVGPPRGTMLMIHGGGWGDLRGDARRDMAVTSLGLRAVGWRVVDIGYTPGLKPRGAALDPEPMLRDVVAFYDGVRTAFRGPVCAYGESAGGHLAAMLAIRRPSLNCVVLAAAPLDLAAMLGDSVPQGKTIVRQTFGTNPATLAKWSPAKRWNASAKMPPVFATSGSNDGVVTPAHLTAFRAADPAADARVIPGPGSDPVVWMHSAVSKAALDARLAGLQPWLDRVVPRGRVAAPRRAGSAGSDCDRPAATTSAGHPRGPWDLLLVGDAWRQSSTPGQAITATRGCSGSARWQDDGLSLWALPSAAVLPNAAEASLVLRSPHVVRRLSASFRGFLARPQDWSLGLYASARAGGPITAPVATCERGRCSGLRLVQTKVGALIAAERDHGQPDAREVPVRVAFTLPPGTRRLMWRLRCVAPEGCSLAGIASARGSSARRRDPLGHPAIFSLYHLAVR